mmetsp:Transcript_64922/g.89156  ORF Transcript_64922/g.89156 Transcript_64922/m.89156 type:complete len:134 (+) Transcript_64922:117-518(+)
MNSIPENIDSVSASMAYFTPDRNPTEDHFSTHEIIRRTGHAIFRLSGESSSGADLSSVSLSIVIADAFLAGWTGVVFTQPDVYAIGMECMVARKSSYSFTCLEIVLAKYTQRVKVRLTLISINDNRELLNDFS